MDNRESAPPPGSDNAALRLAHALGGLAREIELFKGERGSERVHAARLKLAAAHLTIRTNRERLLRGPRLRTRPSAKPPEGRAPATAQAAIRPSLPIHSAVRSSARVRRSKSSPISSSVMISGGQSAMRSPESERTIRPSA
jgi:hypothetical protein